ncbi:BGLU28, partial [Symbiodinium pilosum]
MVLNTEWPEAQEPGNPADAAAVERFLAFNIDWFAEPLYAGDYPELMRMRVGERLPKFTAEEKEALKGSNDFFALNCYSARYICEDTPWRKFRNFQATLKILPYISDVPVARFKAAIASEQAKTSGNASEPVSPVPSALGGPASPPP